MRLNLVLYTFAISLGAAINLVIDVIFPILVLLFKSLSNYWFIAQKHEEINQKLSNFKPGRDLTVRSKIG
jgi:hypothetical protein